MIYFKIPYSNTDAAKFRYVAMGEDFNFLIENEDGAMVFLADRVLPDRTVADIYLCLEDKYLGLFGGFILSYYFASAPKPTEGFFIITGGSMSALDSEGLNDGKWIMI